MSVPSILPPSPPTTLSRKRMHIGRPLWVPTSTPDDSPASLASSSGGARKRVEFSPWTSVHNPPAFTPSTAQAAAIQPLPPSRECQTSSKSILKPFNELELGEPGMDKQRDTHLSSDETMDSIIQQLSNGDRATRVDAYYTLVSLLKAYDEVPEAAVFKSKITLITKFIRRDLTVSDRMETDLADTNLINQALKASVVLVWSQDFAPILADDFRAFVLDRSIQVLAEQKAPKSNIMHYLHLLGTQTFRQNIMQSNNRAIKLLDALKVLPEHYTGNGVVSERLLVYIALLDQARPAMQQKANMWLQELLMGLVSSSKDTRSKAIKLGMKACTVFPSSTPVSNSLREVFKVEMEAGKDLSSYVCRRLEKMISNKEDGIQVPQSWAVVILLMGGLRGRIESWNSLRDWLKVIQRCFNCSDSEIRHQANLAWIRFVSVVRPHETSEILLSMLVKPITSQMERTPTDKLSNSSRATAVSSYCNLLYYAFRPAATSKQYSRCWNEYVVKVMTGSFFDKNAANVDLACRVLIALFWNPGTTTKVWKEYRAHENNPVTPEELPTIDCRWVRAKASSIMQIFDVVARYSSWGPTGFSDQAFIAQAWRGFSKALGEACCREIKPSGETKQAIVSVARYLSNLEQQENSQDSAALGTQKHRLRFLTKMFISQVGVMPILDVVEADKSLVSTTLPNELLMSVLSALDESEQSINNLDPGNFSNRNLTNPHSALAKLLALLDDDLVEMYKASEFEGSQQIDTPRSNPCRFFSKPLETATRCMRSTSTPLLLKCLTGLQTSFSLWLENLNGAEATEISKTLTLSVVKSLDHLGINDVESLDSLLSAGFRSTHKETINHMIEMWNANFGQDKDLKYPALLQAALERLRPFTDLISNGDRFSQDFTIQPLFAPSQVETADLPTLDDATALQKQEASRHEVEVGSDPINTAGEESLDIEPVQRTPNAAPFSLFSTPTRRLRHNDSQVQFVAIESSPMQTENTESQYLTKKQKEVRDRQRGENEIAAFFSDLGSKVTIADGHGSSSNSLIARKAAALDDCPATPTLPVPNHLEEIAASPTPRAKQQALRVDDIDTASSPLALVSDSAVAANDEIPSSPLKAPEVQDDDIMTNIDLEAVLWTRAGLVQEPASHSRTVMETLGKTSVAHGRDAEDQADRLGHKGMDAALCIVFGADTVEEGYIESQFDSDGQDQTAAQNDADDDKMFHREVVKESPVEEELVMADIIEEEIVREVEADDVAKTGENDGGNVSQEATANEISPEEAGRAHNSQSSSGDDNDLNNRKHVNTRGDDIYDSPVPPRTDSDEIDMMSASQLSNDLDWHLEREKSEPVGPAATPKRKGPSKLQGGKRKKQKTSIFSSSDPSEAFFEAHTQVLEQEEIYDCIVVDTSRRATVVHSDSRLASQTDLLTTKEASRRRRGRPSKSTSQTSSQEIHEDAVQASPTCKMEEEVGLLLVQHHHEQRSTSHEGSMKARSGRGEVEEISHPSLVTRDALRMPRQPEGDSVDPEWTTSAGDERAVHPDQGELEVPEDIMASLRKVLDRLKTARPEEVDLRAVHDLCFDIRTEAQNTVQRGLGR